MRRRLGRRRAYPAGRFLRAATMMTGGIGVQRHVPRFRLGTRPVRARKVETAALATKGVARGTAGTFWIAALP